MKNNLIVAAAIALVAGCGAGASKSTEPTQRDTASVATAIRAPFQFDWPVPSSATVHEEVTKKGYTAKLRYEIELSAEPDTDTLRLQISNLQFLEFQGQVVEGAIAEQLRPAMAMAALTPPLLISKEGQYLGPPADFSFKQLFEAMKKNILKGVSDEVLRSIENMITNPAVEQGMTQASGDFWRKWVGAWIGFSTPEGEVSEIEIPIQLAEGITSTAAVTHWNNGPAEENPGQIQLRQLSVQENPVIRDYIISVMHSALKGNPEAMPQMKAFTDSIQTVRVSADVQAVINPDNLRPSRVASEENTEMTIQNGDTQNRKELHRYVFEWD